MDTRINLPRRVCRGAWLTLAALLLAPAVAFAIPATFVLESSTASVSGRLVGGGGSVFLPNDSVPIDIASANLVVDFDTNTINSLNIVASDFTTGLDASQTGLAGVSVMNATINAISVPSPITFSTLFPNVAAFGVESEITADVLGTLPGGAGTVGPFAVTSIDDGTGSTAGSLTVLNSDTIILDLTGVTLATFDQVHNAGGPPVEIKADLEIRLRQPATPIPEPSAALVFGLGVTVAGTFVRRRA